jgi:uncharacterized protein
MRSIPALLLTLALSTHATAQSFDCKLAQSPRERAVCSDQRLSTLDSNVAAAYKAARTKLSPPAFALVQSDQRQWLRWLDKVCPSTDSYLTSCLTSHYMGRLQQLKDGIVTTNGITFYPRVAYSFAPDTRKPEDRDPSGPDLNSDEDVFPQIDIRPDIKLDRSNPAYAAWNATFHPDPPAKLLAKSAEYDITVRDETAYDVIAANDRLINISFTDILDMGGAHPQFGLSNNLWWLDKQRKLIASDVFRPGSGWQQKLVDPAIRKLQADNRDGQLNTGDQLRKAVASAIPRVSTWSVTSEGLGITFQQYEVGTHTLGLPDITFTWNELKPFLAPSLNPSTLPDPLHKPNR